MAENQRRPLNYFTWLIEKGNIENLRREFSEPDSHFIDYDEANEKLTQIFTTDDETGATIEVDTTFSDYLKRLIYTEAIQIFSKIDTLVYFKNKEYINDVLKSLIKSAENYPECQKYPFIKNCLVNIHKKITANYNIVKPRQKTKAVKQKPKPELSLPQIALISFYEGKSISRNNCVTIAKKYGYISGEKLYQLYLKYVSDTNRTGRETTEKKNLNKLKLFEKVIFKLAGKAKERATGDMNTLKTALEKYE